QTVVQRDSTVQLVCVLPIAIQRPSADVAREIPAPLQENHRMRPEEAGECIGNRKRHKNKEAIRGDALEHIDPNVLISAAELEFVRAMDPTDRSRSVIGV